MSLLAVVATVGAGLAVVAAVLARVLAVVAILAGGHSIPKPKVFNSPKQLV